MEGGKGMWVFILGLVIGAGTGIFSLFFVAGISERRDDKKRTPAHFPKEHHKHRKHLDVWKDGWDDVMYRNLIAGTQEHQEQEAKDHKRQQKALESRYRMPGGFFPSYGARDVSEYTTQQWEAYIAGRTAAFDENNRRDVVGKARIDQIDADNAKQARYQAALAEVREEIYGKELHGAE